MTECLQTVSVTKRPVDEVEEFTYLGSVVRTTGGTKQDVEARLGKPDQLLARRISCRIPDHWKGN